MLVFNKNMRMILSTGVAFIAALMFSSFSHAQNIGGVIQGSQNQQSQQSSQGSLQGRYVPPSGQPINQNARLVLEIQSLRTELSSLRNQVEQQGYQLRQLQQNSSNPVSQQTIGRQSSAINQSSSSASRIIQTTPPANGEIPPSGSVINPNNSNNQDSVQFPLLPQDQVQQNQTGIPTSANSRSQNLPQLVPQQGAIQQNAGEIVATQPQGPIQNQRQNPVQNQPQNQTLSRQAQLLRDGDRSIKTNLNEVELYNKGIDKLSGQDYKAAASIFSAQLQNFPRGEKAGDGYFWLGETFYIQEDLDSAAKSYQSLVDRFPNHVRTPKALLKLIGVHQERNDQVSAQVAMNILVSRYSGSPEASSARSQYSSLL